MNTPGITSRLLVLYVGLCFVIPAHAYRITLFPVEQVYDADTTAMHRKLGLTPDGLVVEDFERETFQQGIEIQFEEAHPEIGDDTSPYTWGGKRPSPGADAITVSIGIPGVRLFGVGIGDNDFGGSEQLAINDAAPIQLNTLSGHLSNGQGRAYYLKVEAEANDPEIKRIRIFNGFTIRFDHMILQTASPAPVPFRTTGLNVVRTQEPQNMPRPESKQQEKPRPPRASAKSVNKKASNGTDILSSKGKRYVGDQLRMFHVDPEGVISTSKPLWIHLYYTEGKPFRLSGEVFLGESPSELLFPGDLPDGFALFIREWDGMHRYAFTSRSAQVKRRLHRGTKEDGIATVQEFDQPELQQWLPFALEANWDGITFSIGNQAITVPGPLDMDGANKIAIAPGTKLRNVKVSAFAGE